MSKRLTTLAIAAFVVAFSAEAFATKNVTFQVDMGIYLQLSLFNPATDSVVVRGDFEHFTGATDWSGQTFLLTKSATNDSVYTVTVPFPDSVAGKTINYKFVLRSAGNDSWEGDPNRTYTVTTDGNQQLAPDYFNRRYTAGVTHKITFVADMTTLISQGFTDANDSLFVRGDTSPLNWGPGLKMTKQLLNPKSYSVQLTFTVAVGGQINFKFFAQGKDNFSNTGWETGGNVVYTFADKDTVFASRVPAISIVNSTTTADLVTFTINMNGAREKWHNTLITGLKSVWVGGGVLPLKWPSNWLYSDTSTSATGQDTLHTLIRLWDDGTHGDAVKGDNIWTTQLTFAAGVAQYVEFKYGAVFSGVDTLNGGASYLDNEAGFALNHSMLLTGATQMVTNNFGDQVTTGVRENPAAKVPTSFALSQNYPNPFNPSTQINYSIPKNSLVTLKIYNVLGQEVATIFSGQQKAGNYIVTFDASKYASGVYFYRIQAGTFSSTKKMILMK